MNTLDMREAIYALVEYAGPLEDPRIGWAGGTKPPSRDELLRCERCGREAIATTDIDHAEDCSAVKLLADCPSQIVIPDPHGTGDHWYRWVEHGCKLKPGARNAT